MPRLVVVDKKSSSRPAKRVRTNDAPLRVILAVAALFFACTSRVGCVGCGCDPWGGRRDHDGDRGHDHGRDHDHRR
jgi:hypothetical protein